PPAPPAAARAGEGGGRARAPASAPGRRGARAGGHGGAGAAGARRGAAAGGAGLDGRKPGGTHGGGPRRRGADKVNNLRGQAPHAPAPPGRRAIIAPLRSEKRGPARAAEGANARNRSGPIPPQATNTLERPPGIAGTGAEGA